MFFFSMPITKYLKFIYKKKESSLTTESLSLAKVYLSLSISRFLLIFNNQNTFLIPLHFVAKYLVMVNVYLLTVLTGILYVVRFDTNKQYLYNHHFYDCYDHAQL